MHKNRDYFTRPIQGNGRGVALVRHFGKMKDIAARYVEPTPDYISLQGAHSLTDGVEGAEAPQRNWLFANDMVYMLDGPEQREAEAELSFDYVAEAELTLSRQFHGELVSKQAFAFALNNAIDALQRLDVIKKAWFYGRGSVGMNAEHATSTSGLPGLIGQNSELSLLEAADYIHGVFGLATEAGELLEGLREVTRGKSLDLVNVKEEVGDAKWYMAILARVARFMWGEDERTNIAKLRARFPDRFTEYDANNRNLSVEREILEK